MLLTLLTTLLSSCSPWGSVLALTTLLSSCSLLGSVLISSVVFPLRSRLVCLFLLLARCFMMPGDLSVISIIVIKTIVIMLMLISVSLIVVGGDRTRHSCRFI